MEEDESENEMENESENESENVMENRSENEKKRNNKEQQNKIINVKEELDKIFDDIENIYPKLFELLKHDIMVDRECIDKFDEFFISESEYLNYIQNLFLAKVMLYLISYLDKNIRITDSEVEKKEKYYNKIIKDSWENDKMLANLNYTLKNLEEKNLDEIILDFVQYFMKNMWEKNNYEQIKEQWDDMRINLNELEIADNTKKNLYLFFKNNYQIKKYYEKINFKKEKKIFQKIYEYLMYEISKIQMEKIKSLKSLGDIERKAKEDGRKIEPNFYGLKNPNFVDGERIKIPKDKLAKVFKRWKIKIDLNNYNQPDIFWGDDETAKLYDENVSYDEPNESDRNYKRYLEFKDQLIKYIDQVHKDLKIDTTVTVILTPDKYSQSQEILQQKGDRDYITKDLHDVKCYSFYECNNTKFEVIDENVLVYGIYGKSSGFIFLINELCNEDYSDYNKDSN